MMRHREVSRLEGFSDSVFGFALTLLVVRLDTPMNLAALRNTAGSFRGRPRKGHPRSTHRAPQ